MAEGTFPSRHPPLRGPSYASNCNWFQNCQSIIFLVRTPFGLKWRWPSILLRASDEASQGRFLVWTLGICHSLTHAGMRLILLNQVEVVRSYGELFLEVSCFASVSQIS